MQKVAIVGVGLIGGSFGLALKAHGFTGEVIGVSSWASIETAIEAGAIDRGAPLAEAVKDADLVYLAQPIGRILSVLRELDVLVKPGALVTDAGSTKHLIVEAARRHLHRCIFLGGHPMAGKESRGVANADAGLFKNAQYCMTPSDPADLENPPAREFRDWIARFGAHEVVVGAEEHDRMVALSSHLPQLASTALASLLSDDEELLAGPGLVGATRLAMSSYDIWRDILMTNSASISEALSAYIQKLEYLRENLRSRAMEQEFKRGAATAAGLRPLPTAPTPTLRTATLRESVTPPHER
jgi:prephenate dehydrogenase